MKTLLASAIALLLAATPALADLVFENTLLEFKVAADDTSVTADFPFRNDGRKTIHIVKSESGCSCLDVGVAGGKFEYAPGEVGVIRAVFDLRNYSGTIDRLISIWHGEDKNAPSATRLTVRAHIPVLVSVEPKTLSWETRSDPAPGVIHIVMDPAEKIHVTDTSSSSENFTIELKTLEAGRRYDLIVTPKTTETPGMAVFRIQTDSKNERFRTQQAFAVIRNAPPAP